MRRLLSVSLGFACLLGALGLAREVAAQAATPPDTRTWVKEHDKNGDGRLDREEFHQAVIEAFFFRDKNKDGYLTIIELPDATPGELNALRRNPDGRITLPEYLNALHQDFTAADTDGDGLLTVEEIDIYVRRAR